MPINPVFRGASLEYLLNHSGLRVIVVDAQRLEVLSQLEGPLAALETVIVIGPRADLPWRTHAYAELVSASDPLEQSRSRRTR